MMKMKKTLPIVLAVVIALGALFPVILQAGTASACMGLTPGYWKNHVSQWPAGFARGDSFDTAFGLDNENPGLTLEGALRSGGGGKNALNRHAVAALFNSYRFPYPDFYTTAYVKQLVQNAYANDRYESAKNTLEYANEYGD